MGLFADIAGGNITLVYKVQLLFLKTVVLGAIL